MGFSEKKIENVTTSDNNFANYYRLLDIKFKGHCLINNNNNNNNNNVRLGTVNLYICYTL